MQVFSPVAHVEYVYVCVSVVESPAAFVHVNETSTLLVPDNAWVNVVFPSIPLSGSLQVPVAVVWLSSILNVKTGGVLSNSVDAIE